MNIKQVLEMTGDIELYEKGTSVMWTDEYISKQLLDIHINPENDLASRGGKKIDKFIDWVVSKFGRTSGDVLDIGCGPGLYAQKLAQKGYAVTGVDFSKSAIEYATGSASKKNLDIEYKCMNYLDLDYCETADLIILIYCDFCALSIEEQHIMLNNVYRALKPNGKFVFDVRNDKFASTGGTNKTWEFLDDGFWREGPYLNMSMTKHYKKDKVVLSQHVIYDEMKSFDVYRFWEHYYAQQDVYNLLSEHKFCDIECCGNFLRSEEATMEDGITFYIASK